MVLNGPLFLGSYSEIALTDTIALHKTVSQYPIPTVPYFTKDNVPNFQMDDARTLHASSFLWRISLKSLDPW